MNEPAAVIAWLRCRLRPLPGYAYDVTGIYSAGDSLWVRQLRRGVSRAKTRLICAGPDHLLVVSPEVTLRVDYADPSLFELVRAALAPVTTPNHRPESESGTGPHAVARPTGPDLRLADARVAGGGRRGT